MPEHAPAMSHGPITEVFPDVFFVTGGFRFGPGLSITRNMTVVRQGGDLVVVNSVRLTEEGEAELAKLGRVTHLVRLGAFHGMDDPYYVERFKPVVWAPPGTKHMDGVTTERELRPGSSPIVGSSVFLFEKGKQPEAALILERDGGIIVTCDSYQHWTSYEGCSLLGKLLMKAMGFGPTHIGGPWIKAMGREVRADFDRLLGHRFAHLVPAHGAVLRDEAADGLRTAMGKRFR